ncbi:hypothetical protein DV096_12045 [Bradymonadaceae bacterium TMQ3]|nr:hypothetical protein DV096_12045 [Bradymonadaceae bacterium TMQ3]
MIKFVVAACLGDFVETLGGVESAGGIAAQFAAVEALRDACFAVEVGAVAALVTFDQVIAAGRAGVDVGVFVGIGVFVGVGIFACVFIGIDVGVVAGIGLIDDVGVDVEVGADVVIGTAGAQREREDDGKHREVERLARRGVRREVGTHTLLQRRAYGGSRWNANSLMVSAT